MPQEHPIVRRLREELARTEAEHARLLREREFLERSLRDATKVYAAHALEDQTGDLLNGLTPPARGALTLPPQFRERPNGPRETIRRVIKEHDGIDAGMLLTLAARLVDSGAKDKRRSLAETLRTMRKQKQVYLDNRGGHHLTPF